MTGRRMRWPCPLRALRRDRRGLALIEFAMILPILLILYLGSVQLQDGISCNRKVTIATRGVADLIAQNATGSTTQREIDNSLAAATQVMAPYPAARAMIRLTHVTIDNNYQARVDWSRALNGIPDVKGTVATIPTQMRVRGVSFLIARVTYAYQPPTNFGFIGPIKLGDSLIMLPRNSSAVTCVDC